MHCRQLEKTLALPRPAQPFNGEIGRGFLRNPESNVVTAERWVVDANFFRRQPARVSIFSTIVRPATAGPA